MDSSPHILSTFEAALNKLQGDVRSMANRTRQSFEHAALCLASADAHLCDSVIASDAAIDELEKEVARDSIDVLMRFQPVATDLRAVLSGLRTSIDLERVADLSVGIVKKVRSLTGPIPEPVVAKLTAMKLEAAALLDDSIRSYFQRNEAIALSLGFRDKRLDELNREAMEVITQHLMRSPERAHDCVSLILVARHLERVGDHAKNIGENTVYLVSDRDIRHLHGA